jgi:hypothetical protein
MLSVCADLTGRRNADSVLTNLGHQLMEIWILCKGGARQQVVGPQSRPDHYFFVSGVAE